MGLGLEASDFMVTRLELEEGGGGGGGTWRFMVQNNPLQLYLEPT